MKPQPWSLLRDTERKWVPSHSTDLRATFERIRAERAAEAEAAKAKRAEDERRWSEHLRYEVEPPANVTELRKAKP